MGAPKRVLEGAFALSLFAVLVALLAWNLDALPGLHGDEAWFGLRAIDILEGRSSSPYGMNAYTGAAYPYVVAGWFHVFGVSVLSLRAVGVLLDVVALGLLVGAAAVVGRGRGYAALLVFVLGSLLVTCQSRVAWDVTALAPVLMASAVFVSVMWLRAGAAALARAAMGAGVLLFATAIGVYNHVIFLAFVAALLGGAGLVALRGGDASPRRASTQLLVVVATATVNAALLTLLKLLLYREGGAAPFAVPIAAAVLALEAAVVGRAVSSPRILAALEAGLARRRALARLLLLILLAIGLVLFVVCHGVAFALTVANGVLVKRLFSTTMPAPLVALSIAAAAFVLALYARGLFLALREKVALGDDHYLLLVLPFCLAAALPVLVMSNASRFYVLPNLALLLGAWASWRLLPERASRIAVALFAAGVVPLQLHVAGILGDRDHYAKVTPIEFQLGTKDESSTHFLSTRATFLRLREDGAAPVTKDAFFMKLPLDFYAAASPASAPPTRTAVVNFDFGVPGGISYELEE